MQSYGVDGARIRNAVVDVHPGPAVLRGLQLLPRCLQHPSDERHARSDRPFTREEKSSAAGDSFQQGGEIDGVGVENVLHQLLELLPSVGMNRCIDDSLHL